jgi:ribokinase
VAERVSIVVVGSINEDVVVHLPRLPSAGETVLGSGHFTNAGGKGANQAVAVARLGHEVVLIGRVGRDAPGSRMLAALERSGVDVEYVGLDDEAPTGLAMIMVDGSSENLIAVSPGANEALMPAHLSEAWSRIEHADVVLLQLEIPLSTVEAVALQAGGTVVLNPAPAQPLPKGLLERVDVLVPNERELAILAGTEPPSSPQDALDLAASLEGPAAVVVTLGASGSAVVTDDLRHHVPAPRVNAIDTTAAGDAFCGALGVRLALGDGLAESVRYATAAGAAATLVPGAQPSLPGPDEVRSLLANARR